MTADYNIRKISGINPCCKTLFVGTVGLLVLFASCNKLVEVDPPSTSLTSENVYTNDATAVSVMTGIYTNLASISLLRAQTITSLSVVAGLSADELSLFGGSANANSRFVEFYQNRLSSGSANNSGSTIWRDLYSHIYTTNLAIERLTGATSLTPAVRQQLLGEATFLRAFFYFYLVNLYGDVPLATSSNYEINSKLPRTSRELVYKQIVDDLKEAGALLANEYVSSDGVTPTPERVRPNKWTATALLSRAYLYNNDWLNAESTSTLLINNKSQYDTVPLESVFIKNNKEAIWQLQPVNIGWNTEEGRLFIFPATGPTGNSPEEGYPVFLSASVMSTFQLNDKRRQIWVKAVTVTGSTGDTTFHHPYKYKSATLNSPLNEYTAVFRLAEQYLIRAEARAHLGKIIDASNDLTIVRARAGLKPVATNDNDLLLDSIFHERRVELFSEWGHRWLDIKRSGLVDKVMSIEAPLKAITWNSDLQWFPIPAFDIAQNKNLIQNKGY